MAKIRTQVEFSSTTTSSLTWRIREISDMRLIIKQASGTSRNAALRASVPLLYAHWEGHIIFVARCFVDFLANRKYKYGAIQNSFLLNHVFSAFKRMSQTQFSYKEQISLINRILNSSDRQMRDVADEIIDSRSNLNSRVLDDICNFLSLDYKKFDQYYDFIDKILLKRRNSIAHGEYNPVGYDEYEEMSDRVIELMRLFQNEADNTIQLRQYMRSP